MRKRITPKQLPPGSTVCVRGERDAQAGQVGTVEGAYPPTSFQVRIEGRLYVKPGRILEPLTLGPSLPPKVRPASTERLVEAAYRAFKVKHPSFARSIKPFSRGLPIKVLDSLNTLPYNRKPGG